jgi:DNA-binding transcriptional regulator YdaS (Cro superfamily)
MSAIKKAVDFVGTQDKFAALIGVSQGRVSQWVNGEPVPPKYFPRIHRVTDGQVTHEDLLAEHLEKVDSGGSGLN